MKKIIALLLVITTTVAVSIGATLAYLTDRDSEANVFTVGDVSIDLNEDFNQGSTLIPGVDIKKEPTITNTGKNDAWVWATVAIPGNLAEVVDLLYKNTTEWDWSTVAAVENVTINNATYTVLTALYNEKLAKDAETPALFTGVALDTSVDIDPDGQWHTVVNGAATDLNWNNSNGNPVIYVSAYAMQTEGFATVQAAYDAYQDQWDDDGNLSNGSKGDEYGTPSTITEVSTAAELTEALAEGGIVVLTADIDLGAESINIPADANATLNLNGNDLTGANEGADHYAMFTIPNGASLTITGEGNVTATTAAGENNRSLAIFQNAGKLTINGGTYTLTDSSAGKTWIIATIVDNRTTSASCEAVLTINGGEFAVAGTAKNLFRNYPQQGGSATIIFNDGTFKANGSAETYIWNQEAGTYKGELYFNGGSYEAGIVYEDYNGQDDIHFADGVVVSAYSGNN